MRGLNGSRWAAARAQSGGGVVDAWYALREATMTAASLRGGAPFLYPGDVLRQEVRLDGFLVLIVVYSKLYFIFFIPLHQRYLHAS